MSAIAFAVLGAILLLAGGSSAPAKKPAAKPKLPAPIGTPPAKPAQKVVPGSPPAGGKVPGSAPTGGVKPGTPPAAATVAPVPRPDYLFPVDYPADFTPLHPNPPSSTSSTSKAVKPAAKPLGRSLKQGLTSVAPPSVRASPELETKPRTLPAGYDPAKAKSRARALASHLAKKGPAGYSRAEVKSWQVQAALAADGIYGGSTRGALIYFGVPDPPRPFAAPVATLPYVPPAQR
jgi:hypothetical protein